MNSEMYLARLHRQISCCLNGKSVFQLFWVNMIPHADEGHEVWLKAAEEIQ